MIQEAVNLFLKTAHREGIKRCQAKGAKLDGAIRERGLFQTIVELQREL